MSFEGRFLRSDVDPTTTTVTTTPYTVVDTDQCIIMATGSAQLILPATGITNDRRIKVRSIASIILTVHPDTGATLDNTGTDEVFSQLAYVELVHVGSGAWVTLEKSTIFQIGALEVQQFPTYFGFVGGIQSFESASHAYGQYVDAHLWDNFTTVDTDYTFQDWSTFDGTYSIVQTIFMEGANTAPVNVFLPLSGVQPGEIRTVFNNTSTNKPVVVSAPGNNIEGGSTITLPPQSWASWRFDLNGPLSPNWIRVASNPELESVVQGTPVTTGINATLTNFNRYALTTSGLITITLPASPYPNEEHLIKTDSTCGIATPVTVDGNGQTIDGAATRDISTAYGFLRVKFISAEWSVIGVG